MTYVHQWQYKRRKLTALTTAYNSHVVEWSPWSWSYNSWIYNCLCNQYLSSLTDEVYSIHHYVIKFVSDLWQVGGFLRVLRFSPAIKLQTNTLNQIFIVLAHWNNSSWEYMPIYSDTLFWFRVNQSLLLILKCCMLSGEAVNSNSLEILTNVIPVWCQLAQ
jgi:hypothetical protein